MSVCRWLKWQAGLTFGGAVGILCSVVLSVWGFISWCDSIQAALQDEDEPDKSANISKMYVIQANL